MKKIKNNILICMVLILSIITSIAVYADNSKIVKNKQEVIYETGYVSAVKSEFAVTVGNTADCNFNTIQQAIDSRFGEEIRVSEGVYFENLIIDDIDLILKGGYGSCSDALNDNQTSHQYETVIDGSNAALPVIILTGGSQRNEVTIENVIIQFGTGASLTQGGGVSALGADLDLTLKNSRIENNKGLKGGGINISLGDTDIYGYNLYIYNNRASNGGGIYCDGSHGASIVLDSDDSENRDEMTYNKATSGDGGAIYITNNCNFTTYVGGTSNNSNGINYNFANRHGGGIYVDNGSTLNLVGYKYCSSQSYCNGSNHKPVSVIDNHAGVDYDTVNNGDGGGIYATGNGTEVFASNIDLSENTATRGGGIFITNGAFLAVDSKIEIFDALGDGERECWSPGSCSQITENTAEISGGAVYVKNSNAYITRTHIKGNRADSGTVLTAFGNGQVSLVGLLITRNGSHGQGDFYDHNVITVSSGLKIDIGYTTLADNNLPASSTIIENNGAEFGMFSSIIHEINGVSVYSSSQPISETFDCLLLHEPFSFNGNVTNIIVSDPGFMNRASGDYHLNPNSSPAIDYCDQSDHFGDYKDPDNDIRGWDFPGVINNQGPYDIGYDEINNDLIFANKFEQKLN